MPPSQDGKIRIIAFGAHHDDCENFGGGVAAKWAALGHKVKFVSVTNGDIGHHRMAGGPLAQRRKAEVEAAARIYGIETQVLDHHDGELEPTLEVRREIVRLIRSWRADVVLTHRPNDYHPDHRYTSIAVGDAAFMVTVPNSARHAGPPEESGLPLLHRRLQEAPPLPGGRRGLHGRRPGEEDRRGGGHGLPVLRVDPLARGVPRQGPGREGGAPGVSRRALRRVVPIVGDAGRARLAERYGEEMGRAVKTAEAFEICEYPARDPTRRS